MKEANPEWPCSLRQFLPDHPVRIALLDLLDETGSLTHRPEL
ncbi:hypothetical protein ACWGDT_21040 [Streptomyces avermitilis]